MAIRDIYLKIEQISDYSPVEPEQKVTPPKEYRRDCMRNQGHEDGTIPATEVEARKLTALVYREYLDSHYLVPKPDKLVAADVNEPVFSRRVPGAVIYAHPGDRLRIHVLNADMMPHSLHVHGLTYGIDSDGSWPFGTQSADGRRSDEICPGQRWTYTFDVTDQMVGAWPFHDHSHGMIAESINRGLFGGIIVRPRGVHVHPPKLQLPEIVERFLREPHPPIDIVRPHPRPGPRPGPGPDPAPMGMGMAARPAALEHLPGEIAVGGNVGLEHFGGREAFEQRLEAVRAFLEEWAQLTYVHPFPRPPAVIEVPLFFHYMAGAGAPPAFDRGPIAPGAPPVDVTFGNPGSFGYHCSFHPNMKGTVIVAAGAPSQVSVSIEDGPPMQFNRSNVTVAPGGTVRWTSAVANTFTHTVTEDGGGLPSFSLNGRSFAGNTPTIAAEAGQKIRWYVFNLDLGMMWHNFHPHGQRWQFANETIDVRSLGPAESFVAETTAPPVLVLPPEIEATQDPQTRPPDAKAYRLRGDFLVHCHVEMHMMAGLVCLVRSHQTIWLTQAQADKLAQEVGLPLDPATNVCPAIDLNRCEKHACGHWEEVSGLSGITFMHAALLPNTDKVLFWGYDRPDQSRLFDYSGVGAYAMPANQPADVAAIPGNVPLANIWSAEHAFLNTPDGTLLVHGGFTPRESYLFNPATLQWSRTASTAQDRFYSTSLTLEDGRVLTLFGSASKSIEVYDPAAGTWSPPKPLPPSFNYVFYPWTYLLPGGDLFIAGHQGVTRRFNWKANPIVDDPTKTWMTIAGERSTGGEKGTSVLLPLRAPLYQPRVLILAGNPPAARQTAEMIDLSAAAPAWTALPNLNVARAEQVQSVLLPDGTVFVCGGIPGANGGPAEIFDPQDPGAGWMLCGVMKYQRGYHSAAILLKDGSVLVGGDPAGATTPNERYFPAYYFVPRPQITGAPAAVTYAVPFAVQTPNAASVAEVILLRPGAATHGFDMSQRFVGCAIVGQGANTLQVQAPPDGTVAPPGYYLLFIMTGARVPSVGRWLRLGP